MVTCNLLAAPTVVGFSDYQIIEQTGSTAELLSASELLSSQGQLTEDQSLRFEQLFSGDFFGDGIFCQANILVTYSDLDNQTANSMFSISIVCEDGWSCEDNGFGTASRRPA